MALKTISLRIPDSAHEAVKALVKDPPDRLLAQRVTEGLILREALAFGIKQLQQEKSKRGKRQ